MTSQVKALYGKAILDQSGNVAFDFGPTVPSDGAKGYMKGCIFTQSDGSDEATLLYINVGSTTSANFDAVDVNVAEMALLSGLTASAAELNYLDGLTLGTALASKALTADSSTKLQSLLGLAIGSTHPTNPQAVLALVPPANASGVTANQSYFHGQILPGGAVTIPTGTAPVVASLNIHEPNITATGTVTAAATVRIVDAPTEGSSNYALWVDAGVSRFDGNIDQSSAALDYVVIANTAAALEISDGTTKLLTVDTRNTVKDVAGVTITASPATVATEAAAHINASLRVSDKTITYTGTTGTTSSLGAMAYFGVPTFTDASVATLTTASAIHINAVAAAGGSLTITNSRMISTSVSDCFLTNAGAWTDTSCFARGKQDIDIAEPSMIERIVSKLSPKTWQYKGDDFGRQRVGIVYDDLPDELRCVGEKTAVATGVLGSFALAAIKTLWDRVEMLEAKAAA